MCICGDFMIMPTAKFVTLMLAFRVMVNLNVLFFFFFSQLNSDVTNFQRKYVNEVRRCDEMERRLRKSAGDCL